MGTFNYRRGLRRVYLALAVLWVATVVSMVVSDRWIWEKWRIRPTTWDQAAKEHGAIDVPAQFKPQPDELDALIATLPKTATSIPDKEPYTLAVPIATKMVWIAALSLPIPVTGYLVLFFGIPWIGRGFRND